MKLLMAIVYNLSLLAGTAYLVGWCGWNPWWFLFTLMLLASSR
jgi:hypothetical protein